MKSVLKETVDLTNRVTVIVVSDEDDNGRLFFQFESPEAMRGQPVVLEDKPHEPIAEGDRWVVEKIPGAPVYRLVCKIVQRVAWENLKEIPGHWLPPMTLPCLLSCVRRGTPILLVGPKGAGKTELVYRLAAAAGWQYPCKVDVPTVRSVRDLFGSDAAVDKSTRFVGSALYAYIQRAIMAATAGLPDIFVVNLDEINRVHAKQGPDGLHGLFDGTRQMTITTVDGPVTMKLPPNMVVFATMNRGYAGTFDLDVALEDRFWVTTVSRMPFAFEVGLLTRDCEITREQAERIVRAADHLRGLHDGSKINKCPSYRGCRVAGGFVADGLPLVDAVIQAFVAGLDGQITFTDNRWTARANSEAAQALAAIYAQEIG